MRYRLIMWDFDGTVADTLGGLLRIYNGLAARHGYRLLEDPQAARGSTLLALMRSHGIPVLHVPFLARKILRAQKKEMATVPLAPGLLNVLRQVGASGRLMSIVSSNNRTNILTCLRAHQAEGLFASVVGYSRLFGKARAIRPVLKTHRVAPRETLYIGDEVRDIESAREVGIDVAAVTWGFNSRDILAQHKPDYLIEDPARITELL
jgi:phosphoglycolate phosphatase